MLEHLSGQRTAVEGLAHGLGDLLQRARMGFAPEHLTGPGSAAARQKALGKAGLVASFLPPSSHNVAMVGETAKPLRA